MAQSNEQNEADWNTKKCKRNGHTTDFILRLPFTEESGAEPSQANACLRNKCDLNYT